MDAILLQILNGLDKGGAYALIALGLTIIFGTLGVVNFAHGALFMLGAGYALSKGVHIRADFLYRLWPEKLQGRIDLVLYILLYFPGMLVFLYMATDYASLAWIRGEKGMDTAWMPHMGPIKTALPVGILFLIIQGISETLKSYYAATRGRWP